MKSEIHQLYFDYHLRSEWYASPITVGSRVLFYRHDFLRQAGYSGEPSLSSVLLNSAPAFWRHAELLVWPARLGSTMGPR